MKTRNILLTTAIALVALTAISCKGRHADNTPTGDTVEVVIESSEALDTPRTTVPDTPTSHGSQTSPD